MSREFTHTDESALPVWLGEKERINEPLFCEELLKEKYGTIDRVPQTLRDEFRAGSLPLMPYTNILTFNTRAICLYITCLLNCPWVYFIFEIVVLNILYIYMHKTHETLCKRLTEKI